MIDEADLERYGRTAAAAGLTLSEWVRQVLRAAGREESMGRIDAKLQAVRAATHHRFPAPDIDTMLAEIEQGRATSP